MNHHHSPMAPKPQPSKRLAVCWALVLSSMISTPVLSAQTDISSSPITSTNAAQVKPNIMLLMDTSGSMGWGHMPDEVETQVGIGSIGYKAAQCNVLFYNSTQSYAVPKNADGTLFPTPSFSSARYDAFDTTNLTTVDLSSAFKAYDDNTLRTTGYNDTAQPAYYYTKSGGTVPITGYTSTPCTDADPYAAVVPASLSPAPPATTVTFPSSDGGTWTRTLVGAGEQQNFAIWFTFYRTRILLVKSAASLAFTPLTDSFRVGFITVKPKDNKTDFAINPDKYLAIDDFTTTQRGLWFAKLFSQKPSGSSPTREGLARVGRHYAGKHDGINEGMPEDPVQFACQQNFTIMTTDGYWNAQDESTAQGAFIGGPVDMSGQALVGQRDGSLDALTTNNPSPPPAADFNGTPRPIWDGTFDGTRAVTSKTVHYSYVPCGTYFNMSTTTINKSTSQLLKTTSQTTQSTTQTLQSTTQTLQATTQTLKSTSQQQQATVQNQMSTRQNLQSTTQNLQTTNQTFLVQTKIQQSVFIPQQRTLQHRYSSTQNVQSTSQQNIGTTQNLQSTVQNLSSTTQMLQSTAQTVQSTSQISQSTSQIMASTSQLQITTSQVRRSTSQLRSCDSSTELCTPVAVGFCATGGNITCETVTTGPTLVVSCANDPASLANNWTATTCANSGTGPTPAASCTNATASPANSYTNVSCSTGLTGPTPVASCIAAGANAGNAYTATLCATVPTGPTLTDVCTPTAASSTNAYTTTTCSTATTGPTGVQTCTPQTALSTNSYLTITCAPSNTTNVAVSSCTAAAGDGTNAWTTTTCTPNNTSNVIVPSCTNSAATAGNAWTTTVCSTNNTTNVAVLTCAPSAASSLNSWTTTTCGTNNSALTPIDVCTPASANAGNLYTATICPILTTTNVPVATCTVSGPASTNSWTDTTCPAPVVMTNVPVPSCVPAGPSAGNAWTTFTCSDNDSGVVAVDSCTAAAASAANFWTATTCPAEILFSGPTTVGSCTPDPATSANGHHRTDCVTSALNTPVQGGTCVPDPPSAANGFIGTTCLVSNNPNIPVLTCTPQTANAGNGWLQVDCGTNNNLLVPVFSCAASGPTAANSYTTTTCPPANMTGPTPVATCTPAPATGINVWTSTSCPPPVTTPGVGVASCTPDPATSLNNYIATTCPIANTGPAGDPSCVAAVGDSTNAYITTTCTPNNTPNTGVAACTNSGPTAANGYKTTVCTPNNTPATPVALCSGGPATAANNYTATTCTPNNTTNVASGSCSMSGPTALNGYTTTTCPLVVVGPAGASSCTPAVGDSTNAYTTTTCPGTTTTGPSPVSSCSNTTADSTNAWTQTSCGTATVGPTVVTTCNPSTANSTNGYVTTICAPLSGNQQAVTTYTDVKQYNVSGGTQSLTSDNTTTVGPTASGTCYAPTTQPALPADGVPTWTGADSTSYPSCSAWPCTVDQNTGDPHSVNSLADVAQYYYVNDLRTPANEPRGPAFYADTVPAVGGGLEDDKARWQHMTTFSIALGISGSLVYQPDYKTSATGDFAQIRTGAKNWPLWPDPSIDYAADPNNYNDPRSIDDFWHAAVNGRGLYFSATNPTSVIAGLAGALAGITARVASSTGAGTSNLEPVAGDNFAYLANYTTQTWTGDVQAHEIDINTGIIQSPIIWSAQSLLDATTGNACDNRQIYLFRSGATNNLVNFTWNTRACDLAGNPTGAADTGLNAAEQGNFDTTNVSLLSQYPSMTYGAIDQRGAAIGANLVNFVRGQRGLENFTSGDINKLYRQRDHVLGDVVDGQPVYVRAPFATYTDTGYGTFAAAQAGRTPMLYVAGNDGMLHAFYAGTSLVDPQGGKEAWAMVPSLMLPKLYTLADANYKNVHQYFVDGTPTVSDVYDGSNWKTLLVGGFNDGGKGFYALDVTNPLSPKGMWEFNWSSTVCPASPSGAVGNTADCHLGLSFGHPLISKLSDGTWVVMVTSGYNNVNTTAQTGDGGGYLYVLNALTGHIIYKIPTGAGDATTPSGLAQINNFVDKADINNLTVRVYGTDVLGNIWRFDVNDNTAPAGREATLVGTATDGGGTPQPITIRPELTQVGSQPMLFVGTGKLLGATDVADVQTQSIYGIVDPVTAATAFPNLRTSLAPLQMTQVGSGIGAYRTIACTGSTAQCSSTAGWRVDLPDSGERVNVEMKLRANTLIVGSNVPQISACSAGGYSWLNYLNYSSGLAVTNSSNLSVAEQVANSLIVGLTVIKIGDNYKAIVTTSDAGVLTKPVPTFTGNGSAKRVSWREVN